MVKQPLTDICIDLSRHCVSHIPKIRGHLILDTEASFAQITRLGHCLPYLSATLTCLAIYRIAALSHVPKGLGASHMHHRFNGGGVCSCSVSRVALVCTGRRCIKSSKSLELTYLGHAHQLTVKLASLVAECMRAELVLFGIVPKCLEVCCIISGGCARRPSAQPRVPGVLVALGPHNAHPLPRWVEHGGSSHHPSSAKLVFQSKRWFSLCFEKHMLQTHLGN